MKVIHIIDSGGLYGAESMLLALVQEQKNIGIDTEVISIGTYEEQEKPLELELQRIGCVCYKVRMKPKPSIRQSISLINLCISSGANIIHSHGYKGNIMMAIIPAIFRRLPVVATLHGYTKHKFLSKMTVYQFFDKVALRFLEAVVLVSPAISINTIGIKKRLKVIFNGISSIDSDVTLPFGKNNEDFFIGTMGRLSKEKNFSFLIKAMPEILSQIPNAKLVIHGEGELRSELELLVNEMNLKKYVFLPGYVRDVNAFLKNIDVYVNCSITEGMPITLLEAMRAKCLVLASDISANKFLLEEKFGSLLYRLELKEFVNSVFKLQAKCEEEKDYIRNELNIFFLKYFTARRMAENYKKLYMELL